MSSQDAEPLNRISELADEEHRIRERQSGQRRARREVGLDPADAEVRAPGVIGSYRQ